jgi:sarcosine oxidase, subunit beta
MADQYDAVVVGGGLVGASTLFHLAELGCTDVLLLERGALASGGTGRSCANIRTHYSILSNTELAVKSLAMFRDLPSALGEEDAASDFIESGYIIVAPEGEPAENLVANLALQRDQGAATEQISADEARALHPYINVDDAGAIGWEPHSGYADPVKCTVSFANAATRRGAEVRLDTAVSEVIVDDGTVRGVRTASGDIHAPLVISVLGPWTRALTDPLGLDVPFENYRHTVLTFSSSQEVQPELPIIKDLIVENKMYIRPNRGEMLAGTGDYGDRTDDPDDMNATADPELVALQHRQVAHRLPGLTDLKLSTSFFGPYDITPDWNPVIDAAPDVDGLYVAFGFSGHGFKLAPAIGRALARLVLDEPSDVDLSPYRFARFEEGRMLTGVYGTGSIS